MNYHQMLLASYRVMGEKVDLMLKANAHSMEAAQYVKDNIDRLKELHQNYLDRIETLEARLETVEKRLAELEGEL